MNLFTQPVFGEAMQPDQKGIVCHRLYVQYFTVLIFLHMLELPFMHSDDDAVILKTILNTGHTLLIVLDIMGGDSFAVILRYKG